MPQSRTRAIPAHQPIPTWGLVATIKAPVAEVLGFAAHHLELGAHRLYIFLDEPDADSQAILKAHPKIRVRTCDDAYWQKSGHKRPVRHQVRQTFNATHTYGRRAEVDWLIHIDVDEYLWPNTGVAAQLAALPDEVLTARARPIEALAGSTSHFKGFIPNGPDRERIVAGLYPTFGDYVRGGFLSHVAGKVFVRTGLGDLTVRIHNVFAGDTINPGEAEIPDMALCHCHVKAWDDWLAAYRYRLSAGSYRADLAPTRPRDKGGLTLHELFRAIEAEQGEAGLQAFFHEVCADTPQLRAALDAKGLLRRCNLELAGKIRKHFPVF